MITYELDASIGSVLSKWIEYAFEDATRAYVFVGQHVHPLKGSDVVTTVRKRTGGSETWDVEVNGIHVATFTVVSNKVKAGL
jgi:hypothetical protein